MSKTTTRTPSGIDRRRQQLDARRQRTTRLRLAGAAIGPEGAVRSDDAGSTWDALEVPAGASLIEIAPDGTTLYAGVHRAPSVKVLDSNDGGATWS